jgi:hypothetical protein
LTIKRGRRMPAASMPEIRGTRWFSPERDQAILLHALKTALEKEQGNPDRFRLALKVVSKRRFLTKSYRILAEHAGESAPAVLKDLRAAAPTMLRQRHALIDGFERRLYETWRDPLDLLEMMIVCCIEGAEAVGDAWPWGKSPDDDVVYDVVRRLQAQGCLVATEVLALLKAGFASGAHARWRSLHELAVTASFIREHGKDTAERFLAHEHVEAFKAATLYQTHCRRLRQRRYTRKEMEVFTLARDAAIQKYGPEFKGRYGWAAPALGRPCDQFEPLERHVKLDHLRPYYRMASYPVHATAKTINFSLALGNRRDVLLVGGSDLGLSDPGQCMAISLSQITLALLMLWPTTDSILLMRILQLLVDEIGTVFPKADRKLNGRARSHRGRTARRAPKR